MHLGHRDVIGDADTVLTFEPHPVAVIAPSHMPKLLTPLAVKAEIIASLGVAELIVIRFDAAFAARTAAQFIDEVLVGRLTAGSVSVGENFRFGAGAQGTRRCSRRTGALRRASSRCARSTGRSSPRARSAR